MKLPTNLLPVFLCACGILSFSPPLRSQEFRRGDCNGDDALDISDPLFLAFSLFRDGGEPPCDKACDADDDGNQDVADIIRLLNATFGNPFLPLPAPYPECGVDLTLDGLGCTSSPCSHGPTALAAVIDGAQVRLTWTAADPESGFTSVRLLRSLNAPPAGPDDPAATMVMEGAANAAQEPLQNLSPDTPEAARTYYYAVYGCTGAGACEPVGSVATLTPTVGQALLGGGYVIHWRHAAATICADATELGTADTTAVPGWWKSCDDVCPPEGTATARQMDATGLEQCFRISLDMKVRNIPMGRMISSEFCRCLRTAHLMDFGPEIEQNQGITFFVYDEAERCNHNTALLAETPPPGTNTGIVGHAGFVCTTLGALAWGEAAIFKPDGAGGSVFIRRVLWDEWAALP